MEGLDEEFIELLGSWVMPVYSLTSCDFKFASLKFQSLVWYLYEWAYINIYNHAYTRVCEKAILLKQWDIIAN